MAADLPIIGRFLAPIGTACIVACTAAMGAAHDGKWWATIGREERTGFLAGYVDCDAYGGRNRRIPSVPWDSVEPLVTKHYESGAADAAVRVAIIFHELAPSALRPPRRGGEEHSGVHGFFDGEYWRQSLPGHRRGFVEGYLECLREEGKATRFVRDSNWYVRRLDEWYGIKADDPSEADPQRSDRKIADVLESLKG